MKTEDTLTRTIAARVRAARESLVPKPTQEEIGAKLGLSKVGYGHYERGAQPFSIWHLSQLVRILGRPMEYFLGLASTLRRDEQTLLGAYHRLDGSHHQARVLVACLEMCRIWNEAPPAAAADVQRLPVIVAQQTPEGKLELIKQGLLDIVPAADPHDYAPVDGQPLTELERRLVNLLRELSPEELQNFEQELEERIARAAAA